MLPRPPFLPSIIWEIPEHVARFRRLVMDILSAYKVAPGADDIGQLPDTADLTAYSAQNEQLFQAIVNKRGEWYVAWSPENAHLAGRPIFVGAFSPKRGGMRLRAKASSLPRPATSAERKLRRSKLSIGIEKRSGLRVARTDPCVAGLSAATRRQSSGSSRL
jgi:hypothetical protein